MSTLLIPLFIHIKILDIVDVLLVAFLLYSLYNLLKGTAAVNIFLGILSIFVLWRVVKALQMSLLSDLLGAFISVGFIAFIVVFQPEIRKFLLAIGSPDVFKRKDHRFLFWKIRFHDNNLNDVDPVVQACSRMAQTQTGALIVIAHKNDLADIIETGIRMDAAISIPAIESIFYKNAPLHDGALIILNNKLCAARCILPVSANADLPANLGLRHRSALGITEKTDAVAIIVSEQTGKISYCRNGQLTVDVQTAGLKKMLLEDFGV